MLLKLASNTELMENYPEGKDSIEIRENIVLPLLTIQQFALKQIQELQKSNGNTAADRVHNENASTRKIEYQQNFRCHN